MDKNGYNITGKKGQQRIIFDSYQKFEDSLNFRSYTKKNSPYVFKAWKNSETKSRMLTSAYNKTFLFEQDYWLDFSMSGNSQSSPNNENSPRLNFTKEDDEVVLNLTMESGGGLIETKPSHYMNQAPETGYMNSHTFKFDATKNSGFLVNKHFYFKTDASNFYGKVKISIMPNFKNHTRGDISFRYSTNLDKNNALEN